jgi:cephalosporin-C deacetylase-like acetyl esterase
VHAGNIVLAPDLRGWGESASLGGRPPHTGRYETTMRAFIVGKTMVGMQIVDLLQTFNYLASRPDVNAEKITLLGKGNGGVVALFAAAQDTRLKKTICEDTLVSYLNFASTTFYEQSLFDVIVPGVLKDFDLPDVAAAVAPRSLQIIDARSAAEASETESEIRREYSTTVRTYQILHRASLFQISSRPHDVAR